MHLKQKGVFPPLTAYCVFPTLRGLLCWGASSWHLVGHRPPPVGADLCCRTAAYCPSEVSRAQSSWAGAFPRRNAALLRTDGGLALLPFANLPSSDILHGESGRAGWQCPHSHHPYVSPALAFLGCGHELVIRCACVVSLIISVGRNENARPQ